MNGIALLDLTLACAKIMPSATAAPHASIEWRHLRAQWLAALRELNMSEEAARDMASRLKALTLTDTERFQ